MADAEAALTPAQTARMARAADHWLAKHPRYLQREVGLDAVLVTARGWPRHIVNALDRM
jgi:putative endonuclease